MSGEIFEKTFVHGKQSVRNLIVMTVVFLAPSIEMTRSLILNVFMAGGFCC